MNSDNQLNAMQAMNCSMNDNMQIASSALQNLTSGLTGGYTDSVNQLNTVYTVPNSSGITAWDYWQNFYYPQVIYQSYPVYIRERAMDKGKQAFEIIKILKDKKLVKLEKVSDFIDLMDELIKVL